MALVEISTISLPTERYKRNVVRGRLDLVGEFCRRAFQSHIHFRIHSSVCPFYSLTTKYDWVGQLIALVTPLEMIISSLTSTALTTIVGQVRSAAIINFPGHTADKPRNKISIVIINNLHNKIYSAAPTYVLMIWLLHLLDAFFHTY